MTLDVQTRRIVVHDRRGDVLVERVQVAEPTPLAQIMTRDVVCASEDLELAPLVELVTTRHIGSVPVVDRNGRAIGIVTKSDLVEILLPRTGLSPLRARDVMMPLALTLPETATVLQAATLMVLEDIHHVLVVSDSGRLAGLVSTKDIVRWLVEQMR